MPSTIWRTRYGSRPLANESFRGNRRLWSTPWSWLAAGAATARPPAARDAASVLVPASPRSGTARAQRGSRLPARCRVWRSGASNCSCSISTCRQGRCSSRRRQRSCGRSRRSSESSRGRQTGWRRATPSAPTCSRRSLAPPTWLALWAGPPPRLRLRLCTAGVLPPRRRRWRGPRR